MRQKEIENIYLSYFMLDMVLIYN